MNKYLQMLKSGRDPSGYTAKPAKPQTPGLAVLAVSPHDHFSKMRDAVHGPENIPADCVGALRDPDGGLYLPWGPCLSAVDVHRMRAELIAMVEELSALERWASAHRQDVLTRVIRGPLADLLPNIAYFRERLEAARAEAAACAVLTAYHVKRKRVAIRGENDCGERGREQQAVAFYGDNASKMQDDL
ncbi:hypothetical protein [Burkholderia sp. Bp8990]|uniref:hypothetical protein n=1 Tax=Burkholderia sp. Bp8990 TaxID=2184552 RepID=UPI000F59881F|nr:hypothetical protein [Burkholderia sp. Bp8990]